MNYLERVVSVLTPPVHRNNFFPAAPLTSPIFPFQPPRRNVGDLSPSTRCRPPPSSPPLPLPPPPQSNQKEDEPPLKLPVEKETILPPTNLLVARVLHSLAFDRFAVRMVHENDSDGKSAQEKEKDG